MTPVLSRTVNSIGTVDTFTWTPGGATEFVFQLGSGIGGTTNLYDSGITTATSATVTGIPTDGAQIPVWVFFYWKIDGVWYHAVHLYNESGPPTQAELITPIPGSPLNGSSAVFSWTTGTSVTAYKLDLGTTSPGSTNLYSSGSTTATTVTVTGLPTTIGTVVYATLSSNINGVWEPWYFTYTESPTP